MSEVQIDTLMLHVPISHIHRNATLDLEKLEKVVNLILTLLDNGLTFEEIQARLTCKMYVTIPPYDS